MAALAWLLRSGSGVRRPILIAFALLASAAIVLLSGLLRLLAALLILLPGLALLVGAALLLLVVIGHRFSPSCGRRFGGICLTHAKIIVSGQPPEMRQTERPLRFAEHHRAGPQQAGHSENADPPPVHRHG
jgi:hypothetical protein